MFLCSFCSVLRVIVLLENKITIKEIICIWYRTMNQNLFVTCHKCDTNPGRDTKCDTMLVMGPWFRDYHTCFRTVGLSVPSVPTLCLKGPLMGNDTIYPELLLTVEVFRWSKLPGCRELKDKKTSPLTIDNHLLKHISVTIIYPI